MSFVEQYANKGYLAMRKETTPGVVAGTPNVFFALYEEDLTTNMNEDEDAPIVGNKFARYQLLQGQRDHQGSFSVLAEPKTAAVLMDAILVKGDTTGSNPYAHPYALPITADPHSYTVDVANGRHVHRFYGLGVSEIGQDYDANKMLFNCTASALGAFHAAKLTGAPTEDAGTYTITFDTTYDPAPTKGLVAADTMHLYDVSLDAYINFTIVAVTDTTVTTTTDVSAGVAGDVVTIRPSSPSFAFLQPFLWARTEFRISDTAANALSGAQTRVEQDSRWTLKHNFKEDEGEKRSGGFDPAALLRTDGDIELGINKFYDDPQEVQRFLDMSQRALVIRHFSGTGYELRITINDFRISEGGKPAHKSKEFLYHEFKLLPVYKGADSQAWDVKVINASASV